ncbi:MAG: tyrosine-type recombinase/integrase [Bacteroidota bacterium]
MTPPRTQRTFTPASLARHYDGFLRSLRQKRPETRGTYGRALREFLRWSPRIRGRPLTQEGVERYKRHLSDAKALSPVSVSTYLTALRRFCEYLVRAGVLDENPARAVGGNSRPRVHSREALSEPEVEALLASVDRADERGKRDYAFLHLMVSCALSEIEIVRADVGDLLIDGGDARLRVQGKGRVHKDQAVTIGPEVRRTLQEYLAVRGSVQDDEPLFTSAGNRTRGKRMTTRGVRDRVNIYLEQSGLKRGIDRRVTPYSLRHTAAALMARAGATADEIKARLRLGSVATAMQYLAQHHQQHPPRQ